MKKDYVLLYQVGIANVARMEVDGNARRVLQHAYRTCEDFSRGLIEAGCSVSVKHCDRAGDVLLFASEWRDGAGDLWSESKRPPR
jgi:hypothetical protein